MAHVGLSEAEACLTVLRHGPSSSAQDYFQTSVSPWGEAREPELVCVAFSFEVGGGGGLKGTGQLGTIEKGWLLQAQNVGYHLATSERTLLRLATAPEAAGLSLG